MLHYYTFQRAQLLLKELFQMVCSNPKVGDFVNRPLKLTNKTNMHVPEMSHVVIEDLRVDDLLVSVC